MSLVTVIPSAVRTAGGSADFGGWTPTLPMTIQLDVTAVSGTLPTLALHIEQTFDGVNWAGTGHGSIVGVDAVGRFKFVAETIQGVTGIYRLRWALGGTSPSFTFSAIVHAEP